MSAYLYQNSLVLCTVQYFRRLLMKNNWHFTPAEQEQKTLGCLVPGPWEHLEEPVAHQLPPSCPAAQEGRWDGPSCSWESPASLHPDTVLDCAQSNQMVRTSVPVCCLLARSAWTGKKKLNMLWIIGCHSFGYTLEYNYIETTEPDMVSQYIIQPKSFIPFRGITLAFPSEVNSTQISVEFVCTDKHSSISYQLFLSHPREIKSLYSLDFYFCIKLV